MYLIYVDPDIPHRKQNMYRYLKKNAQPMILGVEIRLQTTPKGDLFFWPFHIPYSALTLAL